MGDCTTRLVLVQLWEYGIDKAWQLIEPLRSAIATLQANPDKFKQFDPPNGWGMYEDFVLWLQQYLCACDEKI